jgi:hypothetical protein|tara:strand:+ start:1186 stop:2277 length:1092 start_codon:yes stop_codon:yes gene_type:complete
MNEQLALVNTETDDKVDVFDMTQYETRDVWCPVREVQLTEYQVPLKLIRRLPKSHQPRVQDCSETAVIEKAEQMKSSKGQSTGICVGVNKGNKIFDLYWGNTRFRGANILESRGEKIHNCDKGFIWASLYEHSSTDLKMYQAIENNVHDVNVRASEEDNVKSILDMISEGKIPNYKDLEQGEQRTKVKELYKKCKMPDHKFQTLWNRIKKQDKATSRKMRTWDKNELAIYFGNNNDYGITKDQCNFETKSGDVFILIVDGVEKKLSPYFVSKSSEFAGATLANTQWKRNINNLCDEIVIIAALNDKNVENIQKGRQNAIDKIKDWNPSMGNKKSVDRIIFVPQIEAEQDEELIAGEYLKDTKF